MKTTSIALFIALTICSTAHADYNEDFGDPRLQPVKDAIKKEQYETAFKLLEKLNTETPRDANTLGLMGYSLRKLEQRDESLDYYKQALSVDPKHLGSNEYLGELYLQMGKLDMAEERLAVIDGAFSCLFGCKEYDKLKEAIEAYKEI